MTTLTSDSGEVTSLSQKHQSESHSALVNNILFAGTRQLPISRTSSSHTENHTYSTDVGVSIMMLGLQCKAI